MMGHDRSQGLEVFRLGLFDERIADSGSFFQRKPLAAEVKRSLTTSRRPYITRAHHALGKAYASSSTICTSRGLRDSRLD